MKKDIKEMESMIDIINACSMDINSYGDISYYLLVHKENSSSDLFKKINTILNSRMHLKKKNTFYVEPSTGKNLSDLLSEDDLDNIAFLAEKITHLPVRGRLYDVLWLYKKPRQRNFASEALNAFSSLDIKEDNWYGYVKDVFYRALYLPKFTQEFSAYDVIESKIMACFHETNNPYLFCEMADIITSNSIKNEDDVLINKAIRTFIYKSKKSKDYVSAYRCLTTLYERYKNDIFQGNGDHKCQLVNLYHARLLDEEGREYQGLHAVNCFNESLKKYKASKITLRGIFDVDEAITALKAMIRKEGKHAYESMTIIKTEPLDISVEVNRAIELVSEQKDIIHSLYNFCFIAHPVNKKRMIKDAVDSIRNHPFQSIFPSIVTDRDGRVLAKTNGVEIDELKDEGYSLENIIIPLSQGFSIYISLQIQARIAPALKQICEEYYIDYKVIKDLCEHCGFIPDSKIALFSQALHFGFEYNFSASVHLLAPLLEDIIRKILYDQGEYSAIIDKNAKSTEVSISTLLDKPKAKEVFDENFLFELKMLLTNNIGSNLRNAVAHGLLDDDTASGGDVVYLWWRILRWVMLSVVIGHNEYQELKNAPVIEESE
ncbi:DUF4209 domain-containing protein [Escherichia coli]|nr:DUF4209 domain-containing protein [Escherichia coli]